MKVLVLQGKETAFAKPTLPKDPTETDKMAWGKDYDLYLKNNERYKMDKAKVFAKICSHCTEPMKNRLEVMDEYKKADTNRDVVALLKLIKEVTFDTSNKKYPPWQAAKAWRQLVQASQQQDESLLAYYKRFVSLVENVERIYGEIKPLELAKKDSKFTVNGEKNKMMASLFMNGANPGFKPLLRDLANDYSLGAALYPATLEEAFEVLQVFTEQPVYQAIVKKQVGKTRREKEIKEAPDLSFAQMTKEQMKKKGLCFKCGNHGHRAFECKKEMEEQEKDNRMQMMQAETESETYSWMGF